MKQMTAVVEHGQIKLPETVSLPDGSVVRIVWDEEEQHPLEVRPWNEEEMKADIDWATGKHPSR